MNFLEYVFYVFVRFYLSVLMFLFSGLYLKWIQVKKPQRLYKNKIRKAKNCGKSQGIINVLYNNNNK